ncbi:flagellar basal body-associated FliL family protein [Roseicella aquatilis]|nr:flagellar basal body-associated FliL family protein [Roseicella aquatilis]
MGDAVPATAAPPAGRSKKKLFMILGAVLLLGGGLGGAWYAGLLPAARGHEAEPAEGTAVPPPVFVEIPDIVANLNSAGRRPVYVKLRSRLEVSRAEDAAAVQAAMPRLLDMFNGFLRETRPEELRGSAGMYRLREELIARSNIALRPGAVTDVLFVEIVIQ